LDGVGIGLRSIEWNGVERNELIGGALENGDENHYGMEGNGREGNETIYQHCQSRTMQTAMGMRMGIGMRKGRRGNTKHSTAIGVGVGVVVGIGIGVHFECY